MAGQVVMTTVANRVEWTVASSIVTWMYGNYGLHFRVSKSLAFGQAQGTSKVKLLRHEWKYGIAFENAASPSRVESILLGSACTRRPAKSGGVERILLDLWIGRPGSPRWYGDLTTAGLGTRRYSLMNPLRLTGHEPKE